MKTALEKEYSEIEIEEDNKKAFFQGFDYGLEERNKALKDFAEKVEKILTKGYISRNDLFDYAENDEFNSLEDIHRIKKAKKDWEELKKQEGIE